MKKSERDKLRKLAEAATPGPWAWRHFGRMSPVLVANHGRRAVIIADAVTRGGTNGTLEPMYQGQPNSDFIAAANPTAILALLDRMEKLEKVAEAAKKAHSLIVDTWPEPVDYEDMEYLRIALSALTKEQDDDA